MRLIERLIAFFGEKKDGQKQTPFLERKYRMCVRKNLEGWGVNV